jgi:hypothetical protein
LHRRANQTLNYPMEPPGKPAEGVAFPAACSPVVVEHAGSGQNRRAIVLFEK